MKKKSDKLIAVAVAGLIAGFTAPRAFAGDNAATGQADTHQAGSEKAGCAGKGGCGGKDKNSCKGSATSEKSDKSGCGGKDGCQHKGSCEGKDKAAPEAH